MLLCGVRSASILKNGGCRVGEEKRREELDKPLCFSFASMKIVNTNSAVSTASINTPLASPVPELSVVRTLKPVGNITLTKKLLKILPASCATSSNVALIGLIARQSSIANVTAGLNKPPEMRKKIHTFTIKLNPNTILIYSSTVGLNPVASPVVVLLWLLAFEPMLATCVPANAKKRNMVVPTNSPMKATKWFFAFELIHIVHGRRMTSVVLGGPRRSPPLPDAAAAAAV